LGISGLLVVDKPAGLTSHDVVARTRRVASTRRVGHTGTLDPMATGVLVLCLGRATRLIPYLEEAGGPEAKEYEARIRFGFETTTDDALGEVRGDVVSRPALTQDALRAGLASFVGRIQQTPPAFSAKKIGGERAYALARRGTEVNLDPVSVEVGQAELLALDGDTATVRFACSRGTYIRALARDLGRALGVGAHLTALRRTRSGRAGLEAAIPLDRMNAESIASNLMPMALILEAWPMVVVNEEGAQNLRLGRAINAGGNPTDLSGRVRVCDEARGLVALATAEGSRLQPFCVF